MDETKGSWRDQLDDRQQGVVDNCIQYASGDPSGLPGHQLMLTIATMAMLLDGAEAARLGACKYDLGADAAGFYGMVQCCLAEELEIRCCCGEKKL